MLMAAPPNPKKSRRTMPIAASNPNPNKDGLRLKLLIDTESKRVLFAEANKDLVDFLFALLSLPIGTVIKLLSSNGMVGSLGKIYQSIENFNPNYLQPNLNKETLLNPNHPPSIGNSLNPLLFSNNAPPIHKKILYVCPRFGHGNIPLAPAFPLFHEYRIFGNIPGIFHQYGINENHHRHGFHRYVSDDPEAQCPQCHSKISTEVTFVATDKGLSSGSGSASVEEGSEGYVKGGVTYMVMDDLQVKPLSLVSTLSMLSTFNIKDNGALEEKIVSVGMDEGLKLLRASLETETVLTDVFLKTV